MGGSLYIGANGGPLILPIAGNGTVTVTIPCDISNSGTSCTDDGDASLVQNPVTGLAFNNGHAYISGYSGGGGISVCDVGLRGYIDHCVVSPDARLVGYFLEMAVH